MCFEKYHTLLKHLTFPASQTGECRMNKKIANKQSDDKERIYQQIDVLEKAIENAKNKGRKHELARYLSESAKLFFDLNRISESESKYEEALSIYRKFAQKNPHKYECEVAETFKALAYIHYRIGLDNKAWQENIESLIIYCKLAEEDFGKYKYQVVDILVKIIKLHKFSCLSISADLENLYEMLLNVYNKFVENDPDENESVVAEALILFFYLWKEEYPFGWIENELKPEEKSKEVEQVLLKTVDVYRRSSQRNPEKYEIKLAKALQNQALFYYKIKQTQDAQRIYKKLLAIFRRIAENGTDMHKVELADHLKNLAKFHRSIGDMEHAELELSEALDIYRKLSKKYPDNYESKIAELLVSLSELHDDIGKIEIANLEINEAIEIDLKITEKHLKSYTSGIPRYLSRLVETQILYDYSSKLRAYKMLLEIYRLYAKIDPVGYEYSVAYIFDSLSDLYSREEEYKEEAKALTEALKTYRRFSEVYSFDSMIAFTLGELANTHARLGESKKAEKEYTEALQIFRSLLKNDSSEDEAAIAKILLDLALLHYKSDKDDEIENELKQALAIYRKYLKKKPDACWNSYDGELEDDMVYALLFLGSTQIRLNKYREAEKNLKEATQISRRICRKDPSVKLYKRYLASSFLYLSIAHYEIGKHENAEIEYKKALKLFRRLSKLDPDHYTLELASALIRLINVHRKFGLLSKANREYKEYLKVDSLISNKSIDKYKSSAMVTLYNELSAKHANTNRKSFKTTWR